MSDQHLVIVAGWDPQLVKATTTVLVGPGWHHWHPTPCELNFVMRQSLQRGLDGVAELHSPHLVAGGLAPLKGIGVSTVLVVSPGVPQSQYEIASARLQGLGRYREERGGSIRVEELRRWAGWRDAVTA
ncbi:MAG: hypothetical protein AB8G96_13520 [Phycisphaerales bacterium]